MTPTEHSAKTPSRRTGSVASRASSLRAKGSGAPSLRFPALLALATAAFLALAAVPAFAARGHVFTESFGTPCTAEPCAPGTLEEPAGVAVNETSGDVYVVDKGNNRVERFSAAGAYLGRFDGSGEFEVEGTIESGAAAPTGRLINPEAIAIDNSCVAGALECTDPSVGDVYVTDLGHRVIDKFSPTGAYLGQIATGAEANPLGELGGVAVDPQGGVWVYQLSGEIDGYGNGAANEFLSSRASQAEGIPQSGFAVDSAANFYVVKRFIRQVAKLNTAGEVLFGGEGGEYAEGATALAVEASSNDLYADYGTSIGRYAPGSSKLETLGAGRLGASSGLAVDAATEAVFVTDSTAARIDVFGPQLPSAPSIEDESVAGVTSTSAELQGEIDPQGESGEAPTHYRFRYGRCADLAACPTSPYEASSPVPDGELASDFETHAVIAQLRNLEPGAVYHFRLQAENTHGSSEGSERTFTTQGSGAFALLDSRQWEMVSPPHKGAALIEAIGERQVTEAAADGGAITYLTDAPTEPEPQGNTNLTQVFSTRGASGWSSRDLSIPHDAATKFSQEGQEYRFFSPDLSRAALQPLGGFIPSLSAEGSEQTAYLATQYSGGNRSTPCLSSCFRPLVSGKAGFANVPAGTHFGGELEGSCEGAEIVTCGPRFRGASADLSHVVLESAVGLTSTPGDQGGLYEWSAAKPPSEQLQLISVLPDGSPAPPSSRSFLGVHNAVASTAVSADGRRVVWSEQSGHLYLRDTVKGETIQLDTVQSDASGEFSAAPSFQFATPDGSKVFFTDHQHLTQDSGGGPSESHLEDDLYECRIGEDESGKLTCSLTDITPVRGAGSAKVQELVLGASEDGDSVYFVANGALTEDAETGNCNADQSPAGATCNLYRAHFDGSEWHVDLVAVLSSEDAPDWNGRASAYYQARLTARASPNGRWLAFMSERPLTGYDNRDAVSGRRDEEVFLYHAAAGSGPGRLLCASCNPTGARPHGSVYGKLDYGLDGIQVWSNAEERGLAASLPVWTTYDANGRALYQSRYLSNSGRLFFNASDSLVPQDSNGTGDVYEYEPPQGSEEAASSNSCTVTSSTYVPSSGGCVDLISAGTSRQESGFLDASESGDDVFFYTSAKLASADVDTARDVYDAHVCTQELPCPPPPPPPPPACEGDACQAPAVPPGEETPASSSFHGAGNLSQHRKHRKKHRHHKHRRAHHNRAGQGRGGHR